MIPRLLPCASVRRMQRMPTGPTGAARENPIARPFKRKMKFIQIAYEVSFNNTAVLIIREVCEIP